MSHPKTLIKVMSPEDWEQSQKDGVLVRGPIDTDFIHMAMEDQVAGVLKKFWKGKQYVLLELDPSKFEGELIYESNRSGGSKYYHLYGGFIPTSSVQEVINNDRHRS